MGAKIKHDHELDPWHVDSLLKLFVMLKKVMQVREVRGSMGVISCNVRRRYARAIALREGARASCGEACHGRVLHRASQPAWTAGR